MSPNWDFWFENKPSGNPAPPGFAFERGSLRVDPTSAVMTDREKEY
jgi:hypothetical protein